MATNAKCVTKIKIYITDMQTILTTYEISSSDKLRNALAAKYAITQLITNIYELSRQLQATTLDKLPQFNSPVLRKTRQIASHDYEAVDFRSIYNLCTQLINPVVQDELERCLLPK